MPGMDAHVGGEGRAGGLTEGRREQKNILSASFVSPLNFEPR